MPKFLDKYNSKITSKSFLSSINDTSKFNRLHLNESSMQGEAFSCINISQTSVNDLV